MNFFKNLAVFNIAIRGSEPHIIKVMGLTAPPGTKEPRSEVSHEFGKGNLENLIKSPSEGHVTRPDFGI
jgi:hypothetical protein